MSEWLVHLAFEEGSSSKFWRARIDGKTLYVNYGKIGSTGLTQVKDFASPDGAQKELDKLVREKRKKGFQDASGGGGGGEDGDEDEDIDTDDDGDDVDAPPKQRSAGDDEGIKLVLVAGGRTVETRLVLDGKTVRMDAVETYASPDAARKAHDRLKNALIEQGYEEE